MTTTIYNSKDVKYIWSTSDDDGLISISFVFEDDIIYATECTYNDDTVEMEYRYYKSTDSTDNQKLWNQLILDNLENFDKYFKEVTDEEDIDYIKHKKSVYSTFVSEISHNLSHDTLRSMIIALYTNITDEPNIPDDVLNLIYTDVINMLTGEASHLTLAEDSLAFIRKYAKESLFETPLLMYRESQYRNMVSDIIQLINDIYA